MEFGPQRSVRALPCAQGHTWHPLAPEPGKPGVMRYHCQVCGEFSLRRMDTGAETGESALARKVEELEVRVAALEGRNP